MALAEEPVRARRETGADRAGLEREVGRLGPWFHNLHLPGGVETLPDHPYYGDFPRRKWLKIAPHVPEDLTGKTALDIGCNAGFYTFELAKRGARVTAIDVDPHYLAQARWAAGVYGLADRITFRQMQVYDLARRDERFDVVWFMGVLYHLRYPMLALDVVSERVRPGGRMVFQTLTAPGEETLPAEATARVEMDGRDILNDPGWPKMAFIEHELAGDPTNWWAPNHAGVEAMLRASGMRVVAHPGHEIYLCEPDPERPSAAHTWDRGEFAAATGRGGARTLSTEDGA